MTPALALPLALVLATGSHAKIKCQEHRMRACCFAYLPVDQAGVRLRMSGIPRSFECTWRHGQQAGVARVSADDDEAT